MLILKVIVLKYSQINLRDGWDPVYLFNHNSCWMPFLQLTVDPQ